MPQIQTLPPDVIQIIAAGEVIDSLAAVVRELAENALDAGAKRVAIALSPTAWRVEVADDGQGMDRENLRYCAQPHSTSKIHTAADLWKITSLGFRGEALHSIAQLANLTIRSRPQGLGGGWQATYSHQGKVQNLEPVALAPGTVITVGDLFGNIPVRRQGLPPVAQQLKEIQTLIHHLALCHPAIHWTVTVEENPWLNFLPRATVQGVIPQLLRRVQEQDLAYWSGDEAIELLLGLPDRCHRRRCDWLKVAINGRVVRSPALEQTLLASLSRTLPRDRYPLAFLHLHLPPEQIDWNRHPAKSEVYLHHLDQWRDRVAQGVDQALRLSPVELQTTASNERIGTLLKTAEAQGAYTLDRRINPLTAQPLGPLNLRVVAQVNQTYIVAEHDHGLWLIEQHIAHERVLFEQLQTAWELVDLDPPILLPGLGDRAIAQLQRLGITVDAFGENLWAVRQIPAPLAGGDGCAIANRTDALLELSRGGDLETAQVATACRSAIRNGTALTLPEMQTLVDQWQQTRNPRTCPHGRPIYLPLEEANLARFFRRHWVIGKSHGL